MSRASSPRVLAIGGLDPSAGAGILADARAVQALGGTAVAVPTCLTVQHRGAFERLEPVDPVLVADMVRAAIEDGAIAAVKVGLLADVAVARAVASSVRELGVPMVLDPVLSISAGGWQASPELIDQVVTDLVPLAAITTPNAPELEQLAGGDAEGLLNAGAGAVLVTGGHDMDSTIITDRLVTPSGESLFRHPRLPCGAHGTGCALASAIACGMADGRSLDEAVSNAVRYVTRRLAAVAEDRTALL